MKEKVLKILLVITLIMTLTIANFITVGIGIVSYAYDAILVATNHKNVEFAAYLKTEEGEKLSGKEESITNEDIRLYMSISVKNEGYFNGEIELQNSNFILQEDKLSEKINKIQGNKISLNQINAGEDIEIEVKIKPATNEEIDLGLLNMESTLKLTGTYKDSTEKDIKIDSDKKVNVVLIPEENTNLSLNAEILTNKIYRINGENKRLVQVLLESGIEENTYPIKSTNIELSVPENVENVEVHSRGTIATNGKSETEFTEANYEYVKDENKVTIKVQNDAQDGKISWNKSGRDVFVVTYVLSKNENISNKEINVKDTVELHDNKNTQINEEETVKVTEEKDGIISYSKQIKEKSIYKGKIYSGEDREYKTTTNIYVNKASVANKIVLKEEQSTYLSGEQEILANSCYKQTVINKQQMLNILGENGDIRILDNNSNVIDTINSNTQADENGNIVINYEEGITEIIVEISKPEKVGTIEIENTKVIKSSSYDKEQLKTLTTLKEKISANYDEQEKVIVEKTVKLKETTTAATLKISRNTLSTIEEKQNTQIEITLKNNNESQDLYKNPIVRIELPSQIEKIDINSINLLYEDQLKIVSSNLNGNVIEIQLQGEQTTYRNDEVIEGTTIIINADLTVNRKAANSNEKIKMTYTNENAVSYNSDGQGIEEQNIEIIAPRGLVTINSIEDTTAIGEEDAKQVELEVGKEAKNTEVGIQVINNNDSEINNVKVTGSFPTKGTTQVNGKNKENTIDTKIVSPIEVSGVDASKVKVYYSEEENATESDTSWTQEISDNEKVRSYLISVDNMAVGEAINAKYGLEIPENLGYNEDAIENYAVTYTNSRTNSDEEIQATPIALTTGKGAELTTELKATVGGEDASNKTIKAGEIIKYTAIIKNTGTEDANNVTVQGLIPNGTVYIEENKDLINTDENGMTGVDSTGEYFKEFPEKNTVQATIGIIPDGESKTFEYQVRVKQDIENNATIKNNISVKYDGANTTSNEANNTLEKGNLRVSIISVDNISDSILSGYGYRYGIKVENTSDSDMENVEVTIDLNDAMELEYIICDDTDNIDIDKENSKCIIKNLKANSDELITAGVYVKQASNIDTEESAISVRAAYKGKQYNSNEINNNIEGVTAELEFTSENENGYVNSGDIIEYKATIKNTGNIDARGMILTDNLPNGLTLKEIVKDGEIIEASSDDKAEVKLDLDKGKTAEIIIRAEVDTLYSKSTIRVTNKAQLELEGSTLATSEEIAHIIEPIKDEEATNDNNNGDGDEQGSDNGNNNENNNNGSNDNDNGSSITTYMISGMAWLDSNENGAKDSDEKVLDNITAKLVDINTGNLAKYNGEDITAKTDEKGFYIFNNIQKGDYVVVFEYDTSKYIITQYQKEGTLESKNSKFVNKTITINGQEGNYAVSDTIKIDNKNISNINIGLIEAKIFDLELSKGVSKIIVQNGEGTKTYNFDNETLAKVEIDAKQLANTTVIIEYTIKVTNTGEVDGYVKNIVDYAPSDLKFSSELNKDWYQSGKYLYNSSLANNKIAAGETKTLTLTLTKTMTESNTGLINNTAEIAECYNQSGFTDIDSTPGNNLKGEDDLGYADTIIGVKTGAMVMYVGLTFAILSCIAVGAYIVYTKIRSKNFINI